jgi:uncharacterized membrane protein YphA (DoxX/SURF4 family)
MKTIFSYKYFLFAVRIAISFIFIYAGIEKISEPNRFALSISNYHLLPIYTINIFAITLPWIELIAGVFLLFGIAVKESSFIIFSMLVVFTIAIIISLLRGLNFDCGCFGSGTQIGLAKLAENFLMIIGSLLLIALGSNFFALKPEQ